MLSPNHLNLYPTLSPGTLRAVEGVLKKPVFGITPQIEKLGWKTLHIGIDGSYLYHEVANRRLMKQGELVLWNENDAHTRANDFIDFLQTVHTTEPAVAQYLNDTPLLPKSMRWSRSERLYDAEYKITYFRVYYHLYLRPTPTEDPVIVKDAVCEVDLSLSGTLLRLYCNVLPVQEARKVDAFTLLDLSKQKIQSTTTDTPNTPLAKGTPVPTLETDEPNVPALSKIFVRKGNMYVPFYLDTNGGEVAACGEGLGRVENDIKLYPNNAKRLPSNFSEDSIIIVDDNGESLQQFRARLNETTPELVALYDVIESHWKSFKYENYDELIRELKIRDAIVKGIIDLEADNVNTASYPTYNEPIFKLNSDFWEYTIEEKDFKYDPDNPKRHFKIKGTEAPVEAIRSIFDGSKLSVLDCNTMSVAIAYLGLINGLTRENIIKLFPENEGIIIGEWVGNQSEQGLDVIYNDGIKEKIPTYPYREKVYKVNNFYKFHPLQEPLPLDKYDENGKWNLPTRFALFPMVMLTMPNMALDINKDLIPGDIVYFKNHPIYQEYFPGGLWSGEWAIYIGNGNFSGFGIGTKTADMLFIELHEECVAKWKEYKKYYRKNDFRKLNEPPKIGEKNTPYIDVTGFRINISEVTRRLKK